MRVTPEVMVVVRDRAEPGLTIGRVKPTIITLTKYILNNIVDYN